MQDNEPFLTQGLLLWTEVLGCMHLLVFPYLFVFFLVHFLKMVCGTTLFCIISPITRIHAIKKGKKERENPIPQSHQITFKVPICRNTIASNTMTSNILQHNTKFSTKIEEQIHDYQQIERKIRPGCLHLPFHNGW